MDTINELFIKVKSELEIKEDRVKNLINRVDGLYKALAKIKIDLDRSLKNKKDLKETAINCVEIARSVTPYYNYSSGENVIDPAYSEEEKASLLN